jgi:putative tryptophan/tyrosine transport system substrate-binding protein
VQGVLVQPLFVFQRDEVAALALAHRLPAVSELRPLAQAGLLFTYGTSNDVAAAEGADYVDKILRGARPGDLPVEGARRIELVFNLRTARALGLEPPQVVLQRADEIIE